MPIHTMHLTDRIFFAQPVGYMDNVDARMIASALKKYARTSTAPIVGIMDTQQVDRMCSTVPKMIAETLANGDILEVVIVIGQSFASQNARVVDKLSKLDRVKIVGTVEEANTRATHNFGGAFGTSTAQYRMHYRAYAFSSV